MLESLAFALTRGVSLLTRLTVHRVILFLLTASLAGNGQARIPKYFSSTELVQVSVVVLDQQGRVATDLTKQNFEVFEDGVKQDIVECMSETAPVSTAFVLDQSRSMSSNLPLVIQGAYNLLDTQLKINDEFLLLTVDNRPKLIFPRFTSNAETIKQLISSNVAETKGLTSLYDAIYLAVANVKRQAMNPHRAVVVITDGEDTNSVHNKKEILDYLVEAEVPVFAVNASEPNIFQTWITGRSGKPEFISGDSISSAERNGPKVLKELTSLTGGAVFTAHQPEDIPRIMSVLYDLISNQYTISYKPPADQAGRRHKIRVQLTAADDRFAGYYLRYKNEYSRPIYDQRRRTTNADLTGP